MVDPIARAYATIGVPRGASARELKQQYKRLVRQWHPDRWANDPVGQEDAAEKMRAINDAYGTLNRLLPRGPRATANARSLTKEEMDAIVQAIGTVNPVGSSIRVLVAMLSIVAAFLIIQPKRGVEYGLVPPSTGEVVLAAVLFVAGLAALYSHKIK